MNTSVNQTALLPCQVVGAPPPLVSWRKDGAPLDPDSPRWELDWRVSGAGSKQKLPGRLEQKDGCVASTRVFSEPKK